MRTAMKISARHKGATAPHSLKADGGRLVEKAVQHIEFGVANGIYPPGHRLVEAEVARQSGLSVGPVREALRLLAGEGLVEIRPFRGASVKRMAPAELIQVYQALKGVVYMSLTLGAISCEKAPARKRLATAMKAVQTASRQSPLPEFLNALTEYYFTLHDIVGNTYLSILVKRLHIHLVHRELAALIGGMDRDHVVDVYRRATSALVKGDAQLAIRVKFSYFDSLIDGIRALDAEEEVPAPKR